MGLLKALFGSVTPSARPYVDEGLQLTKQLIGLLNLSDWASGTPEYTEDEARAIDRELSDFQEMADARARKQGHSQMISHSETIAPLQRAMGADALRRLAGPVMDVGGWELDGDCPSDWKLRVSTYLKAWAMNLDPDVLLEMAKLLALAGHKAEGKQAAAIVAAWFPSYAPQFFAGSNNPKLVESITARAKEIMEDISKTRLLVHGLNAGDSLHAIWKLLFSPMLQKHFGSDQSLEWTQKLIANFADGNQAAFSAIG